MRILTLCTGNVSRSVWLGVMLGSLAEQQGLSWDIRTAGTHAVEGAAVSGRTRDALHRLEEFVDAPITRHRSHQLTADDAHWADLIVCFEVDHVNYVRREHPVAAGRTALLGQLVRQAPLEGSVAERVSVVAATDPERSLEVDDPAGGDQPVYDATAEQVWELAQALVTVLSDD